MTERINGEELPPSPTAITKANVLGRAGGQMNAWYQPLPGNIIAASPEMRELIAIVRTVAPTSITVLLSGESGTGKEVFAQLLHDLSGRSGPFVTVNCGAIPEGLIESELFGHERGAFTGAVGQRKGFFEAAQGGTLFLDEIGEMPLALQVKLLRVLEVGMFTRVGSTNPIKTDARIVAATNRDLEADVRAGIFRSDLYYRLRAVMLRIPPLRNRREDIPFLLETILDEFVERHHITDRAGHPVAPRLTSEATQLLLMNEWRGNIRELRNTMEQLLILSCSPVRSQQFGVITEDDVLKALDSRAEEWNAASNALPMPVGSPSETSERNLIYRALLELRNEMAEIKSLLLANANGIKHNRLALPASTSEAEPGNSAGTLREVERMAIIKALQEVHGNRRLAADSLGISERTLYRKMKEHDIEA